MSKWDKQFFVTELHEKVGRATWTPEFTKDEATRLLSLDGDVLKGAFYMEATWFWPGDWPATKGDIGTVKEHSHEFDETVAFIGTDHDDPNNLCGEIEFWIDGKKNILDKSFIAFIPAGIKHGPLNMLRVDKPIFHYTAGMGGRY